MAHVAQQNFCKEVRSKYPEMFTGSRVIDVGSMNVNGTNRPAVRRRLIPWT